MAATRDRIRQLRAIRSPRVSSPTLAELEQTLHQPVRACELQHANWRNRMYRVELRNGTVLILKQVVLGNDLTVQGHFEELISLSQLQVPGLHVPKPVALLLNKRAFLMEFVPGETITALLAKRARAEDGLRACERAGAVLAGMHRAWQDAVRPLPVEQLAEDMASIPWRLSRRQREMLRMLFEELRSANVSVGRMHYDYEPDNLLFDGERLFVIDPSAGCHHGVQLFEVATFRSALRRRLFMQWMRHPGSWRRGLVEQAVGQFQTAYLAQQDAHEVDARLFALLIRLFELQRLGQMFVYQRAKIEMAREKGQLGWQVEGPLTNRGQLALLDSYKGWLFRQLARDLRCVTTWPSRAHEAVAADC